MAKHGYAGPLDHDAWDSGYRSGRADALVGQKSEYAWVVEETPGYPRSYSLGYRAAWADVALAQVPQL